MWPSRRSLRGQRNRARGGEGPKLSNFFLLPSLPPPPPPFPDVFCESLFFRNKMASPVKRSRTVALSAEGAAAVVRKKKVMAMMACRVAKKAIYTVILYTDRGIKEHKVSCVTVPLRKLAHNAFHFQIILLSSSGHSIYNNDIT